MSTFQYVPLISFYDSDHNQRNKDSESSVGKLACEHVMHSCSKSGIRQKFPVAKMARQSYLMSFLYVLFSKNSKLNKLAISGSNKFIETITYVV